MTKSTITREQLLEIIETDHVQCGEASYLARMALAAMDSESECLPLDYLQGHKDGLEWAAQLAEANHPETGDWLYDDPIELAKAIRKGPDMPPAQSVADSEPVIVVGDDGGDALSYRRLIQSFEPGTKLYRHAQPAPVVPDEKDKTVDADDHPLLWSFNEGWNACRAAMLQELKKSAGTEAICRSDENAQVLNTIKAPPTLDSLPKTGEVQNTDSPVIPDGYVMVPVEQTKEILDEFDSIIDYGAEDSQDAWRRLLAAAPQSHGSEPATVPGKWIPVSERMPEVGVKVLCFPVKDEPIHATFNGQLWLQDVSWSGSEEPIDNVIPVTVTHWMPLPAAPQEVR
ncbi:DUF551 domain-containing protein [Klebsiella pneumoniae]|nr:DUF551 domain-containing protein [Klebsiella pneumoniae]WPH92428.1 DUF551 domain-containing protein [Klebsiella pneumoniae]